MRYGMRAARPSERAAAKAAPIRASPVTFASAVELIEELRHLGQVLVAAARETNDVEAVHGGVLREQPCDRVRWLEGGDDALQAGELMEGAHGVHVGNSHVAGAAAVA